MNKKPTTYRLVTAVLSSVSGHIKFRFLASKVKNTFLNKATVHQSAIGIT